MQKLSRNQAANAVSKPQKQSGRKKGHKDDSDNDDVDEPASDEDKIAESVKPKKGAKSRGQGRTFPAKRKSKESDDDDDNTEDNDGEDDEDQKKVTNNKQLKAEKTNKKKVPTGKNGKNAKKKAK